MREMKYPVVLGHEIVGTIVKVGSHLEKGVKFEVGDRVGIPWLHSACGECSHCCEDREHLCSFATSTGFSHAGGLAEYMVADPRFLVTIPENVNPSEVAPVMCSGLTAYAALRALNLPPTSRIAVVGLGRVGNLVLQYAHAMSFHVTAVDKNSDKLEDAKNLGADLTVDSSKENYVETIKSCHEKSFGVEAVVIAAPDCEKTLCEAMNYLRPGGKCVLLAIPEKEISFDFARLVLEGKSIIGSIRGNIKQLKEAVDLVARGIVKPQINLRSLDDVSNIYDNMAKGQKFGHHVVTFHESRLKKATKPT
eukprot:TRINITY_DN12099_c0_g1_i1.p1 TRINITY_DN12099_c0_g1~~TRINITY_DN12099_c0_g1_i1.p1  ORF type:complete len:319 (-),score=32.75 TRINITY_DN12099_c0_g1_i1:39-959(-)